MSAPKLHQSFVSRLLTASEGDAAEALAQLSSFWSARARLSETGELIGLSPSELAAHLALWYFGEVGNGGHVQYFMNPIGAFAHETIPALEKLGLEQAADILHNAIQVFPGRRVPKERTLRFALIKSPGHQHLDLLHHSDLALWKIANQVDIKILRYLQKHQDEVLAAEQA